MKFGVTWPELGEVVVEVDAKDRWEAVVRASGVLGLDKAFPMSFLYRTSSVKRPGKETLGRRRSTTKEERESKLEEVRGRLRGELAGVAAGECSICGLYGILVTYSWMSGLDPVEIDVCEACNKILSSPRTSEVLEDSSPFEVRRAYVETLKGLAESFLEEDLGPREGFLSFFRKRGRSLGIDVEPWVKSGRKTQFSTSEEPS